MLILTEQMRRLSRASNGDSISRGAAESRSFRIMEKTVEIEQQPTFQGRPYTSIKAESLFPVPAWKSHRKQMFKKKESQKCPHR